MPRFVTVGRLAPQKGYEILLHALALISESLQPKQIRIIGNGPERERLEALSNDLRVANLVEWLGELTQVQVAEQLALANVFLLPSMYEGFSNAGLEAMERGLPLILTRCGGLDVHVDTNTGWVVPPGNPVALAGAISHAISLSTEQLSAMGAHARALVEHNFDIKVTARRYIALFESIQKNA